MQLNKFEMKLFIKSNRYFLNQITDPGFLLVIFMMMKVSSLIKRRFYVWVTAR